MLMEDVEGSSETPVLGNLTFHKLNFLVASTFGLVAIAVSFGLIYLHATNYTKPNEQRHIIRILFMIPVYSVASCLSLVFYWKAIYFQVLSDCYEAIALASFFALLCNYVATNLHDQKNYFRSIQPRDWVWPASWFKLCCGMAWRTPRSGLTWFNIIWVGVYQYCFIRVSMTIVAVVTQYFGRYCESSQSPLFAHIWVLVIEGVAVTIAMYCLVQFYAQLSQSLAEHRPFLKILSIKLVIFLSFWQSFVTSLLTSSTFHVVRPNSMISYSDLKVGLPSVLSSIEMALFSILHLYAFPYKRYKPKPTGSDDSHDSRYFKNETSPKQGGPLGSKALVDAMNPWDLIKCFARAVPWLFVGRKNRESDISYKTNHDTKDDNHSLELQYTTQDSAHDSSHDLPIAGRFSNSGHMGERSLNVDEGAGLIAHAQSHPIFNYGGYIPAKERYDANGHELSVPFQGMAPTAFVSRPQIVPSPDHKISIPP